MLNPYICPIDGDLSRADTVVLVQLCRKKHVVEYGVGASTILLAQVAKSLISFDTDLAWIEKVEAKLEGMELACKPRFLHIDKELQGLPKYECDVLFDDGHTCHRPRFLQQYWIEHIREAVILHDARTTYAPNIIKAMLDWYDAENFVKERDIWPLNPYTASLSRIDWCPAESNMVVLHKRNCVLKYENWNVTEKESNRDWHGKAQP